MQFASARPINPTTGVDNDGDGGTNDRPIGADGKVMTRVVVPRHGHIGGRDLR